MNRLRLVHTVGEIVGLLGHLVLGDELIHLFPEKLLFRVEEELLEGGIAHHNSPLDIEGDNGHRAVLDEGVQVRGPLGDSHLRHVSVP